MKLRVSVLAVVIAVGLLDPTQIIIRNKLDPDNPTQTSSDELTCTTTLASLTQSTVSTAMSNASDGDVICLPSGSATWSSRLTPSLTKGVTIAGAAAWGGGTTTITTSATILGLPDGSSDKLYRFTGFTINFSGGGFLVWTCPDGGCDGTISKFRFDHNTVTQATGSTTVFVGEGSATQYVYGVIDHNTVTSPGSSFLVEWIDAVDSTPASPPLGTANNLFVEDNSITNTSITDLGQGCTDGWGQAAIVYRHNTSLNCRILMHAVTHEGGPSNFEVYDNTITEDDTDGDGCYRCIHHQGANTYMVFDNTLTATSKNEDAIVVQHYRSFNNAIDGEDTQCDGTQSKDGNRSPTATWRGYPCWRQPGRDVEGTYTPIYAWNNTWSDTSARIDMVFNGGGSAPDYSSIHMVENREWYNQATSFDGTTGMGVGLLANRPSTCTTSTETAQGNGAAGVGYFATDAGSQGTLYTCSATNTWTAYYTPYTYPHPLVSGS